MAPLNPWAGTQPLARRRLAQAYFLWTGWLIVCGGTASCGFQVDGLGVDEPFSEDVGQADTSVVVDSFAADASADTLADTSVADTSVVDATFDVKPAETVGETDPPDTGVSDTRMDTSSDLAVRDVPEPSCTESGAIRFNGHCYFLLAGSLANQGVAKSTCVLSGAHLVTITSAEEHLKVHSLLGSTEAWIGLERPATSLSTRDSFVWNTKEPTTYSAGWGADKPDGTGPCVVFRGTEKTWADRSCSNAYPPLCERE